MPFPALLALPALAGATATAAAPAAIGGLAATGAIGAAAGIGGTAALASSAGGAMSANALLSTSAATGATTEGGFLASMMSGLKEMGPFNTANAGMLLGGKLTSMLSKKPGMQQLGNNISQIGGLGLMAGRLVPGLESGFNRGTEALFSPGKHALSAFG